MSFQSMLQKVITAPTGMPSERVKLAAARLRGFEHREIGAENIGRAVDQEHVVAAFVAFAGFAALLLACLAAVFDMGPRGHDAQGAPQLQARIAAAAVTYSAGCRAGRRGRSIWKQGGTLEQEVERRPLHEPVQDQRHRRHPSQSRSAPPCRDPRRSPSSAAAIRVAAIGRKNAR